MAYTVWFVVEVATQERHGPFSSRDEAWTKHDELKQDGIEAEVFVQSDIPFWDGD